ncbi:MAG: YcjX family protein [Geminicoccaceae bacterium]
MSRFYDAFGIVRAVGDLADEFNILTDRALDRHIRLAVTGLRRSGKTVFITSLVHHLLDGYGLPFLSAVHDGRYLGGRLVDADRREAFPYRRFHAQLGADPPTWPKATDRLASLRLELAYKTKSLVLRQVQPIQHLTLDVIDYPGEWLLDLPLLETSYEAFSEAALAVAERPLRRRHATPFLQLLRTFNPDAPADQPAIARISEIFATYLKGCQNELGLSFLQPGRFTNPGDLAGSRLLHFFPVPPGEVKPGSNRALLAERYDYYREKVVREFYDRHFSRFDRQIVLVDLLTSLNAGPDHFADTQEALTVILESFRYGSSSLFGRLFAPKIDKVLFAVSKADHVAPNQHANLKQLLELMITPAARSSRYMGIERDVIAVASVRCTDVVRTEHQGQVLSCVRGRLKDEARETVLFPGEIPGALPEPEDWKSGIFRFRDFAPRRLVAGVAGQHIRLDQALEFLLGDKLR